MRPMIRLAALSACVLPLAASAGYFQWEAVELPASTGASCGNGSPYRFFVNRTPFTTKTVVIFEGGGATLSGMVTAVEEALRLIAANLFP